MRDWTLNFGKHRGEPLDEIPSSYLDWVLENVEWISERTREAIDEELERRRNPPPPPPNRQRPPSVFVTPDAARDVVSVGRRVLAKQHHPDAGGDPNKMIAINASADWLETMIQNNLRPATTS